MKFIVKIEVNLKPRHSNPEGETVAYLLKEIGYQVENVDVSKVYTLTLDAASPVEAKTKAEDMSKRLFVNPVKDDYTISIVK